VDVGYAGGSLVDGGKEPEAAGAEGESTKIAHATYNDDGLRLFPAGVLPVGPLPVDADGQVLRVRPALQCARLLIAGPDVRARAAGDVVVLLRVERSRRGIAPCGWREHGGGLRAH